MSAGAELSTEEQRSRGSLVESLGLTLGSVRKVAHLLRVSGSLRGRNGEMCTLRWAVAAPWRMPCGKSMREVG